MTSAPGSSRQSSVGSSSLSTGTSSKPESIATSTKFTSGPSIPGSRDGRRPGRLSGAPNGMALFVDYGSTSELGAGQDEPLFSPDLANPTFSLPPPFRDDVPESSAKNAPIANKSYLSGDSSMALQPPFKRLRYSVDTLLDSPRLTQGSSPASLSESVSGTNPNAYSSTNLLPHDSPVTPAASSSYSEDDARQSSRSGQPSPDIRRMSVNSLLTGPPGPSYQQDLNASGSNKRRSQETPLILAEPTSYYGVDRGFKDLDMGKNDDMNAITGSSPKLSRDVNDFFVDGTADDDDCATEFGFGVETNDLDYGPGGYYDKPVFIRIPRNLEPLPSKLLENPMNLLYFHHFMNHTARVLVPHDDPVSNPFRTVLPHMAVTNDNLLSLLLAYSGKYEAFE